MFKQIATSARDNTHNELVLPFISDPRAIQQIPGSENRLRAQVSIDGETQILWVFQTCLFGQIRYYASDQGLGTYYLLPDYCNVEWIDLNSPSV